MHDKFDCSIITKSVRMFAAWIHLNKNDVKLMMHNDVRILKSSSQFYCMLRELLSKKF